MALYSRTNALVVGSLGSWKDAWRAFTFHCCEPLLCAGVEWGENGGRECLLIDLEMFPHLPVDLGTTSPSLLIIVEM